jgi:hypothetical protein
MKYFPFLFMLFCCGDPLDQPPPLQERNIIAYVCNNPDSIWHLSECNEQCTRFDPTGIAYCQGLTDVMCEENRDNSEFLRRACGIYYR